MYAYTIRLHIQTHTHTHIEALRGGGGGYGGSNTPLWPHFFSHLLVRQVSHVQGYPYPVYGKLTLFFRKEKKRREYWHHGLNNHACFRKIYCSQEFSMTPHTHTHTHTHTQSCNWTPGDTLVFFLFSTH